MKFKELANYFYEIEKVSSRLQITILLSSLFKEVDISEIQMVVYLLQGRIAPLYQHIEFGMAEKMIIRAIVKSLGVEADEFISVYKQKGDLGITVEEFRAKIKIKTGDLSVKEVFTKLKEMAQLSGTGSQDIKISILSDLISQLDPLSSKYLVGIPTNTMRLGFSDMTVLDAFSWMLVDNKSLRSQIEKAYHVRPDLGEIGHMLKKNGIDSLEHIYPSIFTPIIMMRAERLANPAAILEKLGPCAIESKFDGFRLQIHFQKGEVKLYSRNLDDVTYMYPDIVGGAQKQLNVENAIFEGEAIGFDPDTHDFLPFQETVQRKRKYGIEDMAKLVPLKLFVFELLFIDNESLIEKPFSERRKILTETIHKKNIASDTLIVADEEIVETSKRIEVLFEEAITKGLEGIVAKKLSGIYQAGARGFNWIKFKKSYSAHLQDTIDCLIMGYDYGMGKRSEFGIGAFLVGVYDEKKDEFVTVTKIGTGLTDDEWRELKKRLSHNLETKEKPTLYNVDKNITCDVWVKPSIVVEVKADEISRSPIHTAGRIMKQSEKGIATLEIAGYALRFPRVEKFRDDKRPEEATSLKEIEEMYKNQGKK